MVKLERGEYALAENLVQDLEFHLALCALINGDSPGEIYLDDKDSPGSLFAMTMGRGYLAGESSNQDFNRALERVLVTEIYPHGIDRGEQGFALFYSPGAWGQALPGEILEDIYPRYENDYLRCCELSGDWKQVLPAGYDLVEVDQALVENEQLEQHADLIEEIHSECSSTADFLEKRFGFCVLQGDRIITWCLSEYNSGGRCEVGIATHPDHRRKGLAKAASLALVEKAFALGYHEVGWHCYAGNEGSIATALSAGFEKAVRYPAYWVSYDRSVALGVQGNQRFEQKAYLEAAACYLKAIEEGGAPAWIYWNAACAYANLDEQGKAFDMLNQAVDHGFDERRAY